jgi:hypothetical protein
MHKKTEIHQMQTMLKCISAGEIHQPQKRTACISQRVQGRIVKIIGADDFTHLRCIVKRPQETRCKSSAFSAEKQNFDFDIEEIEERTDFKNERINGVEELTTKNRHAHHMPILCYTPLD